MESPRSVPCEDRHDADEFEDILPMMERRRRSHSFDNADIDLTYSEDINSPIAEVSFFPRMTTEGAPKLSNPPLPSIRDSKEFTLNPSTRPEDHKSRQLVFADYDLSEEEDDLLIGEENDLLEEEAENETENRLLESQEDNNNVLETSFESAPLPESKPLIESAINRVRSASISVLSPADNDDSDADEVESKSLLDLSVPSLATIPMRRVASTGTPFHLHDREGREPMPHLSQSRFHAPPMARRRGSSPHPPVPSPQTIQRISASAGALSPGLLQRQVWAPILTPVQLTRTPSIHFTDDGNGSIMPPGDRTPKNSKRGGASIFRSGRAGNVASPNGVRTPLATKSSRHRRDSSSERLTLSAPYALRRHSSLPVTDADRSSPLIHYNVDTGQSPRAEVRPPSQNRRASVVVPVTRDDNGGRSLRKGSIGTEQEVPDETDEELAGGALAFVANKNNSRTPLHDNANDVIGSLPSDDSTRSKEGKIFFQRQKLRYILYLSAFSVFGSSIRVFLVRLFGARCEVSDPTFDEFCVTASGRTMQRGGALFADLPANMVGCFIMGLMTSLQPDLWPPLPWFSADHPLQQHDAYHVGIRAGLCGTITTFASWNAQMVVMMDGTHTQLGPQVVTALCGYVIGFFCAIMSFFFGTNVSTWLTRWRNPEIARDDDEEVRLNSTAGRMEHEVDYNMEHGAGCVNRRPPTNVVVLPTLFGSGRSCRTFLLCKGHPLPFILLACLLLAYAIGGFLMNNPFYRTLFYSSLCSPPGALIRWELSKWNTRHSDNRWRRLHWLPIGTFVANILGSLISITLLAMETRYLFDDTENKLWAISLVTALRIGFAGSLSTVSTMVKELFELNAEFPHHAKAYKYVCLTVSVAALLCLSVYSPIVRSG